MTVPNDAARGKVYLVGAGPGDPGLITLRGVECLRQADVILFDYLVNPRVLEHARAGAEQVCLGRHGRGRIMPQEEVNARLVAEARSGKTVVRLKGGDPAVFARGVEEVEALLAAGVPHEIVPGVTAALAAGSFAGIPITHRELASAVALVTGQEDNGKSASGLDYEALARFPGTLVMYMGVTTAPQWTAALIAAGKRPDTPAAIIRRCSWPDQTVVRCTLDAVADELKDRGLRPPVIVILGEVATLSDTLDWFSRRPLFGVRVMVTRPAHQADGLRRPLEELGAEVILHPAIEITDPPDWSPVDAAIEKLAAGGTGGDDAFDWVVFSSTNGVQYFLDRILSTGHDLRILGRTKLAVVGPGTADELSRYHLKADLQPDEYQAEALAAALSPDAANKNFLLIRASRGREVLAQTLTAASASVTQIVVYTSLDAPAPSDALRTQLTSNHIDWITITSSAIARSLVATFGDDLNRTKLASISPITSATLRELGHEPTAEATEYTMTGVLGAILEFGRVKA